MVQPYEVEQYKLVFLSTGHLEEATANTMTAAPGSFDFIVAPFNEGFFVSAQRVPEGDFQLAEHPSLEAVLRWAHQQGYGYVALDRDAEAVEGLPTYDW